MQTDAYPEVLDRVGDELLALIAGLAAADLERVDLDEVVVRARWIQRLVDGVITELTRCHLRRDRVAPVEGFLNDNGGMARSQVRAEIDRAQITGTFPAVAARHRGGHIHTGNLDALARVINRMTDAETAAMTRHDAVLADAAGRLSEDSFRKRVTRLRDRIRADHGTTSAEQVVEDAFFRICPTKERDAYRIAGMLAPIEGASIHAAVQREVATLAADPGFGSGMSATQLAARALHDLVLRGDRTDRTETPRANVQIHVLSDWDTLDTGPHADTVAETHHGVKVSPANIGRLCCDATLRRIATAPDARVHVSRAQRTPTAAQRAALRALYACCPISGSGWESIDIHHVVFYEQSQRTVLSELVPISRRWHHVWPAATPSCSLRSQHRGHDRYLSHPDGTPFRTIAPPVPANHTPAPSDLDLAA